MPLSYDDALAFLYPRTTTIKFGLETTEALLDAIGRPHELFPTVHIGGTNGKGSVSTMVASALAAHGWRVGLYTSPHLVSFRERMLVEGVPIGEEAVAAWTERLMPLILERQATFFEVTTAIAFADFAARGVDLAVIEVGMGGRLDSTNVVQPLVSCVTKVDLDHQKFLGDTREAIAREKAWIAKPGVPFVIGEERPAIVAQLRAEGTRAVRQRDPLAALRDIVVPVGAAYDGPLQLLGAHQRRNAAVALEVLRQLPMRWRPSAEAMHDGLSSARIPGRLDRRGRWLFDVAHNRDSVAALAAAVPTLGLPRPLHGLVAILADKDWRDMLVALDPLLDRGVLTVPPTAAGRRWDVEEIRRWTREGARPAPHARWRIIEDFPEAIRVVQQDAGSILCTGSFHTVGDAMAQLGIDPLGR